MRWYVARTHLRKERYAVAALQERGVETYLPILLKRRPRAGRRHWEPLFASYLFARMRVPSQEWLAVRASPGVAYFLGHDGEPTALPDDFIAAIQARLGYLNGAGGLPVFNRGQRVSVVEGSFKYYDAIFDRRLSSAGRSRVLLNILNRLVPVELPEDYLRATG